MISYCSLRFALEGIRPYGHKAGWTASNSWTKWWSPPSRTRKSSLRRKWTSSLTVAEQFLRGRCHPLLLGYPNQGLRRNRWTENCEHPQPGYTMWEFSMTASNWETPKTDRWIWVNSHWRTWKKSRFTTGRRAKFSNRPRTSVLQARCTCVRARHNSPRERSII